MIFLGWQLKSKVINKDTCFMIPVSRIAMSKNVLVQLRSYSRSSKFLLREHAFIENRKSNLFLWGVNVMHFLNVIIFGWRNFFRVITTFWVALLNWYESSTSMDWLNFLLPTVIQKIFETNSIALRQNINVCFSRVFR